MRGRSSVGRALRSQCRGQGFDPPRFHQSPPLARNGQGRFHSGRLLLGDYFWETTVGLSELRVWLVCEPKRAALVPEPTQACHVLVVEFVMRCTPGAVYRAARTAKFSASM